MVAAGPAIIFVATSVSVSVTVTISVYVFGVGLGESTSLPIGLVVNVLDIGVFYGPSPPSFPPTVLPEADSVVAVVAILTTIRPPGRSGY